MKWDATRRDALRYDPARYSGKTHSGRLDGMTHGRHEFITSRAAWLVSGMLAHPVLAHDGEDRRATPGMRRARFLRAILLILPGFSVGAPSACLGTP